MFDTYIEGMKLFFLYTLFAGAFFVYLKKNGLDAEKEKKIKLVYAVSACLAVLIGGVCFFFADKTSYLECRADTMECRYSFATPLHPEPRPTASYDISKVHVSSVNSERRRSGKNAFTILLHEGVTEIELPIMYRNYYSAVDASYGINRFLKNKLPVYAVEERELLFSRYVLYLFFFFFLLPAVYLFKTLFRETLFVMREKILRRRFEKMGMSGQEIETALQEMNWPEQETPEPEFEYDSRRTFGEEEYFEEENDMMADETEIEDYDADRERDLEDDGTERF